MTQIALSRRVQGDDAKNLLRKGLEPRPRPKRDKTMTTKILQRIALCALILSALVSPTPAVAEWGEDALDLQEHLDVSQPLNDSLWIGTHNSFNAGNWDSAYIDPNQTYKPKDQLRAGARELTFDVYPVGNQLRMCHGACSGLEKKFRDGLQHIRDWLKEGNRDSVILLKLEVEENRNQAADQLESKLGDYIYKPQEGHLSIASNPSDCHGLEPEFLSKEDVLAAGKNVIVLATSPHGCPSAGRFKEWVHIGFEYSDDHGFQRKFERPTTPEECQDLLGTTLMSRLHDANTYYVAGGTRSREITEGNVDDYLRCGLNVLELYNLNGYRHANDPFVQPGLRSEDLVWSWATGQPDNANGGQDCAQVKASTGRFEDAACADTQAFACYSPLADAWQITAIGGPWLDGEAVCADEFGAEGYSFAVPTNLRSLETLLDHPNLGSRVWVNYHDLSREGVWQANRGTVKEFHSSTVRGGSGGSAFDDLDLAEQALLYSNRPRRIVRATLYGGLYLVGVELQYSDGRTVLRGSSSSAESTLDLGPNEAIEGYDFCHRSVPANPFPTNAVAFLELSTNQGRSISLGSRIGSCYYSNGQAGRSLIALQGRQDSLVNALGFHFWEGDEYEAVVDDKEPTVCIFGNCVRVCSLLGTCEGTFGTLGSWPSAAGRPGFRNDDFSYSFAGSGENVATWTFDAPNSGYYKVFARWTDKANRATNAKYRVLSADGTFDVVVDQQKNGGHDNLLGTFFFNAGEASVQLTNDGANGVVIADSVKLEYVSP